MPIPLYICVHTRLFICILFAIICTHVASSMSMRLHYDYALQYSKQLHIYMHTPKHLHIHIGS